MIRVKAIEDALTRRHRKDYIEDWSAEKTVTDYCPPNLDRECTSCIDSSHGVLPPDRWDDVTPEDGSELIFMQYPAGIGAAIVAPLLGSTAGGTAVAATSGSLVVGAAGTAAAGTTFVGASVAALAIDFVIGIGVSYLTSAVTRSLAGSPGASRGLLQQESAVHSFRGIRTTSQSGISIPVAFGENVAQGGNILQMTKAVSPLSNGGTPTQSNETIAILVSLGHGPYPSRLNNDDVLVGDFVNEIRLNGNPANQGTFPTFQGPYTRPGTFGQEPITDSGFGDTRNVIDAQSFELTNPNQTSDHGGSDYGSHNTAVVPDAPEANWFDFDLTNDADRFYLNAIFPQGCYTQWSDGSTHPLTVRWQVRYRKTSEPGNWVGPGESGDDYWGPSGTPNWTRFTANITHQFQVTEVYEFPERDLWTIQVRRVDGTNPSNYYKRMIIDSIEEAIDQQFAYPGMALVGFRVKASALFNSAQGQPQIEVRHKGQVVEYWGDSNAWEPSPSLENPGAIIPTILRNSHWGLAAYIDQDEVDALGPVWRQFYDWCDEDVDDGNGGSRKRASFNGVFDGGQDAWRELIRIMEVANGTIVASGEAFRPKWEYPRPPSQIFNDANIIEGSFKQQWLDQGTRPNVFEVRFMNADEDFQPDAVGVPDVEAEQAGDPQIGESADALGVTDAAHAMWLARRLMRQSRSSKIVEWRASLDAIAVEVGDVVTVAPSLTLWSLAAGRCKAGSTGTSVRLDQTITFEAGETYQVQVRSGADVLQTRTISSTGTIAAGDPVQVTEAWDTTPSEFDVYTLGHTGQIGQNVVISAIHTAPNFTRRIVAIPYDPGLHDDSIESAPSPSPGYLPEPVLPPCPVSPPGATERLEAGPAGWISNIDVTWVYPSSDITITGAKVYYRENLGGGDVTGWQLAGEVPAPVASFAIQNVPFFDPDNPGTYANRSYDVTVVMVGAQGVHREAGSCDTTSITLQNGGLIPGRPQNVTAVQYGDTVRLQWDPVYRANIYEIRRGESWSCSTPVGFVPHPITTLDTEQWAPSNGTAPTAERFHVRAVNTQGLYGAAGKVQIALGTWFGGTADLTRDESGGTPWSGGTKTNTEVDGNDRLVLSSGQTSGTYETGDIDLGFTSSRARIGALLWCRAEGGKSFNNYGSSTLNGLTQMSFAGPINPNDWPHGVELEFAVGVDQTALGSASYMPLVTLDRYNFRWIKFRLTLTEGGDWTPQVKHLVINVEDY